MATNGNNDKSLESWICALLGMERAVGDYVIVHELLHFSVPHHGKLWKSLMRAHLGDYEKVDRKLKRLAHRAES